MVFPTWKIRRTEEQAAARSMEPRREPREAPGSSSSSWQRPWHGLSGVGFRVDFVKHLGVSTNLGVRA